MSECLFCKMISGEIAPDKVYEDDDVLAFRDISPQAPHHVLVIPKEHISTLNDLDAWHAPLLGKMYLAVKEIAKQAGVAESGYRTVMNCNQDGGQTVYHIHLHMLAGRDMQWPPG
ncbi:MAG: histidine triad nucleotide-binding protein [Thiotrichaceae bacterium]|nr:histidine triad nucleotide-binding protein [Thiotrichaceae bacterium]PCI11130.1 MAG: histidine triad nucleotide-binding protein [Thiotrichales bacterium]PCI12893.1 MAG: histidine triad nucleotide-binding protein [Thiotrichales bacterium]